MIDNSIDKNIAACIAYLKRHGYEVIKKTAADDNIGKWVAYRREGMNCVLHGKIIGGNAFGYTVRKKNHSRDFIGFDGIIAFFDDKKECYNMK